MLEIIEFDDGEYGIRDQMSGQILSAHGVLLSFTSYERAEKRAKKIAKKLNRELRKQEKKGNI